MMLFKKIRCDTLALVIIIAFITSISSAEPMYYTFEGIVSGIDDGAGLAAEAGVYGGMPVKYIVEVDYDRQGSYTSSTTGITYEYEDGFYDYSYADLISGSYINEKDGGCYLYAVSEYNYVKENVMATGVWAEIRLGPFTNQMRILDLDNFVKDWAVGDEIHETYEMAFDGECNRSYLFTALTVTDISDSLPFVAVEIDIEPYSTENLIRFGKKSVVKVAILSNANLGFDSRDVDPASVKFGPNKASPTVAPKYGDVNKDGLRDSLYKFLVSETGIQCEDGEATLTAEWEDQMITATDYISCK